MVGSGPIHVAHVIGSAGVYGAERWILAQMRYLDTRRCRAAIINLVDTPGEKSAIVSMARARGFTAVDFYTGGRFDPFSVLRLAEIVRQNRFAILHSHGYKSDIMGLIAGRFAGTKVISTPHGWGQEDKKLLLYEWLDRVCLKFFDRVCPLSASLYDGLCTKDIKKSKMTLILNGVDIREIDEAPVIAKSTGKRRIGYIGQFIERKNLGDLVEAFFRLERNDCELHLIGDGPCREEILRCIESQNGQSAVSCPGYAANRLEELKGFDVFVLPSLLEGIPRCIMEAHAACVPVVATDIEGVRDLVISEQTGLLVPPRNPVALAWAIDRILNSPELGKRLAAGGRQLIEESFSAAKMAAEYESLYLSISPRRTQHSEITSEEQTQI